ncbi:FxsA family protein [Marinitenerispora sediminis]|uniref:Exlusion protein FxsA n=1 Tax=Marinitenerispora sediminis TaxID=1931232 RepID=A0A368SZZ3_9ACTN|nr:FxsA family protein [Marinitenerispora sediminis]RCV48193.1 exlusion protein FxsA [Marinitenerispora sediminis]RCV49244.1 exlusion protein FxsA [Marinitenerispora sediminis]RCV51698.1 exlusion protein FxsA [Marinitenerispora sediminis]
MPLLAVLALMALPFLEIWVMILVGQQIGVAWTILALFAMSAAGVLVTRRAGTKAFRDADEAMRTGQPPRGGLLDTLMLFVGGVLLTTPGFITGLLGLVMALPVTRPALRWAFTAWATRRMARMTTDPGGVRVGVRVPGQPRGEQPVGRPGEGTVIRGHVVEDGDSPAAS